MSKRSRRNVPPTWKWSKGNANRPASDVRVESALCFVAVAGYDGGCGRQDGTVG
jgi:hypothetical protein